MLDNIYYQIPVVDRKKQIVRGLEHSSIRFLRNEERAIVAVAHTVYECWGELEVCWRWIDSEFKKKCSSKVLSLVRLIYTASNRRHFKSLSTHCSSIHHVLSSGSRENCVIAALGMNIT